MQPNYNAGFAFDLLNPHRGIVNATRLHGALKSNLKLDAVEKDIVSDIIERLAYVNEQELILSDMIFFEPSKQDPSYETYRENFRNEQDEGDSSWHKIYAQFWKALINTVKNRRIVQKEMSEEFPDAVNYLFEHLALDRGDKASAEEIKEFVESELNCRLDDEQQRCIMQCLDRDQDGFVSYVEFCDAFYGAE